MHAHAKPLRADEPCTQGPKDGRGSDAFSRSSTTRILRWPVLAVKLSPYAVRTAYRVRSPSAYAYCPRAHEARDGHTVRILRWCTA